MGRVVLVGAGPGDPGLLTRKGLKYLQTCDAIIYDRLASEELLKELRPDCVRVYVGKKPGAHSMRQEEINELLVEYGGRYELVVRLKGGDPFVFGRGGEEIQALHAAGIPFEVVPGVTSAIAVPELAGIPVTHRGAAQSFHVITGHAAAGMQVTEVEDYAALAGLHGTLVFLMGLAALPDISEGLLKHGKPSFTPAAVIAAGTTPQERIVRGTLSDITEHVAEAGLTSPAVIVIGETAGFSFCGRADEKERKRTLGVIGTAQTIERFRQELKHQEQEGRKKQKDELLSGIWSSMKYEVLPLIMMETVAVEDADRLRRELKHVGDYDWVLFTSKQGVEIFFQTLASADADIRTLAGCRFGVIGEGTAAALRAHGIHADFVPEAAVSEESGGLSSLDFAHQFAGQHTGQSVDFSAVRIGLPQCKGHAVGVGVGCVRVLLPRAKQGNPGFSEVLNAAGMEVTELLIYDVQGQRQDSFLCVEELCEFVFFSASGVRAFFCELKVCGMTLPEGSRCYCIGNATRMALWEMLGGRTDVCVEMAQEPSIHGLVQSVIGQKE